MTSIDAHINRLLAQHGGVAHRDALVRSGISRSALGRRVADGRLVQPCPRTFMSAATAMTRPLMVLAAVRSVGEDALASHECAAELLGVWGRGDGRIDVVCPRRVRPIRQATTHHSSTLLCIDRARVGQTPITAIPRLLVDLGDVLTHWQVASVIHEAQFRNLVNRADVDDAIARNHGRHSIPVVRAALHEIDAGRPGTRSRLEDRFLAAIVSLGLPIPLVNSLVETPIGLLEVDCVWPHAGLIVEVDGPGHLRRANRARDAARDAAARRVGFEVIRCTAGTLYDTIDFLAGRL